MQTDNFKPLFLFVLICGFSSGYAQDFNVNGNIFLPSSTGNKQIYTWSSGDPNWRIGMSETPGFTRSLATSHVQYLTYGGGTDHGFAVGVNGGQSSFEIVGNHTAFFRGYVGIGAISPDGFQVNTTLSQESSRGVNNIRMGVMGGTPRIILDSNGNTPFEIDNNAGQLRIFNPGTVRLVVNSDGKVGIGTTSPTQKLSVAGQGVFLANDASSDPGDGAGPAIRIGFSNDYGYITANNTGVWTRNLVLQKNGGNVGIGTSAPDQLLTVNGTIHSKEVKVDLSVPAPDYVFEKDYNLPSLEEIKTYIDQNKHLPEVPSAKEMEANGVQLGEMNMLLLKKVEELTLHIIELEQRIKQVEQK